MQRLEAVDGLRGVAALFVMFHHFFTLHNGAFQKLRESSEFLYQLSWSVSELNVAAVLLFFLISGFSIRISTHKKRMTDKEGFSNYFCRRLTRLLPLYFFAILFTYGLGAWTGQTERPIYSLQNLLGNIFFLQSPATTRGNWFVPYGGNYPLWSLSFEMFFYILYPVHLWLARKGGDSLTLLVHAFFLSMIGLGFYQAWPNPLLLFLSGYIVWFLGVNAADVYLGRADRQLPVWVATLILLSGIGVLQLMPSDTARGILTGLAIYILWRLVMSERTRNRKIVRKISRLFSATFKEIGHASYAIYLLHYPVLAAIASYSYELGFPGMVGVATVIIIVSWLIETTAQKYRYSLVSCKAA